MNLYNLFEDDSRTPSPNYAEELAYQIFKAAPNLDTTGAADEVLDYAFDLAVHDLGRKRAHSLFAYDEDFDSDLVNAYLDLQMNQQAVDEGWKEKLAGAALAGTMALGAGGAHARVVPGADPDINRLTGKPIATQQVTDPAPAKAEAPRGFSKEYLQQVVNGTHPRPMISVEKAQQLLSNMQEGEVYEADPRNFDSDEDYYAAQNAPAKRRSAPSDYPYSPEEDDAYFREIFRKKREAAKKAAQDKGSLSEFAEKPENGPGSDEYEDLLFHLAWEMWSEAGDSAQAERKLSLLGWKPEFGDDYTAMVLYKIGNDDDHRQYTIDEFEEYGGSDDDLDESRMSELDAEYEDYKKLSPREFFNMYRITKQAWLSKYKSMLPQQPTDEGQQWPDNSNSIADRKAVVPNLDAYRRGETSGSKAGRPGGMTVATRVDPTITPTSVKRLGSEKSIPSFLQKGVEEGQEVDASVVIGKLYDIIDYAEDVIKNADFDSQVQKATIVRDKASKALNMIKSGTDASSAFKYFQSGQQGVAEADKKKEDEPEPQIKDVALQRAITRAKADFPTAGSGLEALSKDFMRSQDQDQQAFDQLRQAERKQDQMLGQIAKIDQEQEKEINDLENQNSTLASRLQQLQNVNGELEKKLAAMSGRRAEKKSKTDTATAPAPVSAKTEPISPATKKAAKPKAKAQPATSKAIGQIAKTLSPPAPSAAIGQMAQQLQPRQKELDFDNNPVTVKPKKFDTSRATDVVARDPREIAKDVKQNIQQYGSDLAGSRSDALRNLVAQDELPMENDDKEANYSNKYQDMVKRMGQKAREQEKSKPVDIKDLARRLAAIEASRKD